jgi:hypothetical protein
MIVSNAYTLTAVLPGFLWQKLIMPEFFNRRKNIHHDFALGFHADRVNGKIGL